MRRAILSKSRGHSLAFAMISAIATLVSASGVARAQACNAHQVTIQIVTPPDVIPPPPITFRIDSTCGSPTTCSGTADLSIGHATTRITAADKCTAIGNAINQACDQDPNLIGFGYTYRANTAGCTQSPPKLVVTDYRQNCAPGDPDLTFGMTNSDSVLQGDLQNQSGWQRDYEQDLIFPGCPTGGANGVGNLVVLQCVNGVMSGVPVSGTVASIGVSVDLSNLVMGGQHGTLLFATHNTAAGDTDRQALVDIRDKLNAQLVLPPNAQFQLTAKLVGPSGSERALVVEQPFAHTGITGAIGVSELANDNNCAKAAVAGASETVGKIETAIDNPSPVTGCASFGTCPITSNSSGLPALAGSGTHLSNSPYVAKINRTCATEPTYTGASPFVGTWAPPAFADWIGSFSATGPAIWSGTTAGTTTFSFTGLPGGFLPVGTLLTLVDVDGPTEQVTLTPSPVPPAPVPPWLSVPIQVYEDGSQDPGHDLTMMPGWSYDPSTGTYVIDPSTIVTSVNPSIGFTLSTLVSVQSVTVVKPGSTNFSVAAPCQSVVANVPATPGFGPTLAIFALLGGCALGVRWLLGRRRA